MTVRARTWHTTDEAFATAGRGRHVRTIRNFANYKTASGIFAPSDPSLCVVYGWIVDGAGDAISGAVVRFTPTTPVEAGGYTIGAKPVTATTNASGYFELELVQSSTGVADCVAAGISGRDLTVPAAESIDFAGWDA